MALVRPRLTDHFGIPLAQAKVDFAIPFLDEDIPLYVDPFLLWRSPSQQDQSLHTAMVNSFNHLGLLAKKGKKDEATKIIIALSECDEVGLGLSKTRKGQRIGQKTANELLELFERVPEYNNRGFIHFEEIQFFVDQISKDRISDFACNLIKSFLVDYTMQECQRLAIPTAASIIQIYDYQNQRLVTEKDVYLPVSPVDGSPVIFVPKRWLRFVPWLDFDDYFEHSCPRDRVQREGFGDDRVAVLTFNRHNYGAVLEYVKTKERKKDDCRNDPLFRQIPITSAKRSLATIKNLPSGLQGHADKKYEEESAKLLASLLYPQLDFAQTQSRTDSGVLIRDLIFYNNRAHEFLSDIFARYHSVQLVFELKNVREIEGEHINQLNRYLKDEFGSFGVLVTRNPLPRASFRNTIDLWSGQRKCIIAITDDDLELMVQLFESKQRDPLDVIKMRHAEFSRACPG